MSKLKENNLIKIKICGITQKETVNFLVKNSVDYFGLIFYEKSPRFIDLQNATELVNISKNTELKAVGVFVNYALIDIQKYIKKLNLKFIQLHGDENELYIKKLKNNNDVTVIKAIGIKSSHDLKLTQNYKSVDIFLFDYKPKDNELPGGNAKTFNWQVTKNINISKKWFLSGGINENNIKKAISMANPYGIDISSGVEKKIGVKSIDKISKLLKIIRKVNEY